MKVVKEKKIRLSSEITNLSDGGAPLGEAEKTLECADGFVHFSDGEIMISYMLSQDGSEIQTDITVTDEQICVKRCGAVSSDFRFKEGARHKSLYSVGAYSFDAEVISEKQRYTVSNECVRVYVYYSMLIGGARKHVKMKIIAE